MFKNISKIKYSTKEKEIKISLNELELGINFFESFLNTIYNKLLWEDLSIGFQCKVLRNPNLYNANFWHYFTNTYVTSVNVRSVTDCSSCEILNHFFDNQIHQNSN